jgi:hypothetical protein
MGYDVHITRAEFWADNEGHEITTAEWLEYVQRDPELLAPDAAERERVQFFVQWRGHSMYPDPWFGWHRGDIFTKNPDKPIMVKMLQIAKELGARVQGDDGEFYDDASQIPE